MGELKKSSNAADEDEFRGKRIIVTGGTRGIGAAIVDRLTAGGGQVITTGRSMQSGLSWRYPPGPAESTGGSCRVGRVSGVGPRVIDHWKRVCDRWRNNPDGVRCSSIQQR